MALRVGFVAGLGGALLWSAACLVEIRDVVPTTGGNEGGAASGGDGGGGAGADGGSGGSSTGGAPPCPSDMVHATDGANVSFCIDRTEVTRAAYVQFLASVGGTVPISDQPAECSTNTELTNPEDGTCPDFTTASQLPVNCVDWCDAHAYCKWAGKRMCQALAGGPLGFNDGPVVGEWHFACTGGLQTVYPYGNTPNDAACNIPGNGNRAEVGTFPLCEGGFPGIFDMQGNVSEWIDACESSAADALCKTRGGHTYSNATYWKCANDVESTARDYAGQREVGIRCCKDPE